MAAWEPIASILLVAHDPLQSAHLVQALLEDGLEVLQRPFPLQGGTLLPPAAEARSVALVILVWPALAGDPTVACAAVARWRRSDGVTPLLVLPDQADEEDRAALLDSGADDVLANPLLSLRECVARCRAILRRVRQRSDPRGPAQAGLDSSLLEVGPLRLDRRQCRVSLDGQDVNLTPREFRLLECFMLHPGQALSREQLIEQVWGPDYGGDSKSVDVHVLWLRRKLDVAAAKPKLFITVRGVGYRLDPPRS
jgi:two-component system phosphate regulon response regulator PhoB